MFIPLEVFIFFFAVFALPAALLGVACDRMVQTHLPGRVSWIHDAFFDNWRVQVANPVGQVALNILLAMANFFRKILGFVAYIVASPMLLGLYMAQEIEASGHCSQAWNLLYRGCFKGELGGKNPPPLTLAWVKNGCYDFLDVIRNTVGSLLLLVLSPALVVAWMGTHLHHFFADLLGPPEKRNGFKEALYGVWSTIYETVFSRIQDNDHAKGSVSIKALVLDLLFNYVIRATLGLPMLMVILPVLFATYCIKECVRVLFWGLKQLGKLGRVAADYLDLFTPYSIVQQFESVQVPLTDGEFTILLNSIENYSFRQTKRLLSLIALGKMPPNAVELLSNFLSHKKSPALSAVQCLELLKIAHLNANNIPDIYLAENADKMPQGFWLAEIAVLFPKQPSKWIGLTRWDLNILGTVLLALWLPHWGSFLVAQSIENYFRLKDHSMWRLVYQFGFGWPADKSSLSYKIADIFPLLHSLLL